MNHNYNTRFAARRRQSVCLPEKESSKTSSFKTISDGKLKLARFDPRYRCFLQRQLPIESLLRDNVVPPIPSADPLDQIEAPDTREGRTVVSANKARLARHDPRFRCFVEHDTILVGRPETLENIAPSTPTPSSYQIITGINGQMAESSMVRYREVEVFRPGYDTNGEARFVKMTVYEELEEEDEIDDEWWNTPLETRDDDGWPSDSREDYGTEARDTW
jgi:hypothetical protein